MPAGGGGEGPGLQIYISYTYSVSRLTSLDGSMWRVRGLKKTVNGVGWRAPIGGQLLSPPLAICDLHWVGSSRLCNNTTRAVI